MTPWTRICVMAIWLCRSSSNTPDTNIHALRDILKNLPDLMVLRWKQEGSVPVLPPKPDGTHESARNFLGFRDGSANPDARDAALMDKIVWVSEGGDEPAWSQGGYLSGRANHPQFRRALGSARRSASRNASSDGKSRPARRFGGNTEHDVPDYSKDPEGKITPLDAHITHGQYAHRRRPTPI